MGNAELPQNLSKAADELMRIAASQADTRVFQLEELEAIHDDGKEQSNSADVLRTNGTIPETDYSALSEIGLMKKLSALEVSMRADSDLKQYLADTFPDGYKKADPLLRLYSWDAYLSKKNENNISDRDKNVLEAQQYQIRQMDKRKIEAGRLLWAEKASAEVVQDMASQVKKYYLRDETEAYEEYDFREAQKRADIVSQRAEKEIETFLSIDVFVKACEDAGYSMTAITAEKPEYAVYTLRSLLNEWQKNGVLEPKQEQTEDSTGPIALTAVRKALRAKKTKTAVPTSPTDVTNVSTELIGQPKEDVTAQPSPSSAGARAYEFVRDAAPIVSVTLTALEGEVTQTFPIDRTAGAR